MIGICGKFWTAISIQAGGLAEEGAIDVEIKDILVLDVLRILPQPVISVEQKIIMNQGVQKKYVLR